MTRPKMTSLQTIWHLELVLNRLREEMIFVTEESERLLKRPWAWRVHPVEAESIIKWLDTSTSNLSIVAGFVGGLRLRLKEQKEKDNE
jgi:hypothetical protein